ncbi:uncharacterized protein LOC108917913 [Anoplophora glabripennis]|uniref:uncharacterized protein LOC108917913 n=1 Tax=Anoplophora glabripennis TaxID=217634 RepID=UPI0008740A58|nr:uncharacterized protein LOC108917913 [Anoplophora glabripennis]
MPSTNICSDILKVPDNIRLADPSYGRTGKIDMLFGVTVFWNLLGEGQIKLGTNKPILQNTELGWIISDPASAAENKKLVQRVQSCNLASGLSVQDQLEKFWVIEEYPRKRLLSEEEEECELIFRDTTQRDENGRFIVQLPIRSGIKGLGDSYEIALKRFRQLERKFIRDNKFMLDYHKFIREYISMGHMSKVGAQTRYGKRKEINTQGAGLCYLPHHGVMKETSVTTKLRVVFDASAATSNGISLNNRLMVSLKSDSVSNKVTKRSILSMSSQIFDPLGLVGPVIVNAKLMLQGLWKLDLGWDDEVPSDILHSWNNFQVQIQKLDLLEIPRQVLCDAPIDVQIHCFCDASQVCYGAAIYIRSTDKEGNHHVNLLCAKSRVAPLKVISLPRLELCGALLLPRIAQVVIEALNINYSSITYWCDSSVVLCWLAGEPVQWTTFVGNRVAEIQRLTKESAWKHIRSESNAADIISRGLEWKQLHSCRLWWQGPDWLIKDGSSWPQSNINRVETVPERKTVVQSFVNKVTVNQL